MRGIQSKYIYIYIRTDFRLIRIHKSSIRENVTHELPWIKIIVARFVVTEKFLIGYSNGHMKSTYRPLKKFADYF